MSSPADPKLVSPQNLPLYEGGGESPSLYSASDRNREVRVLNALKGLMVKPEGNGRFLFSDGNAILDLTDLVNKLGQDGSNPGGSGAQRFLVYAVAGDYLTCRTWDGTTIGTTDIYVAKSKEIRQSITSEIIEGVTWSYTYASRTNNADGQRTAGASGHLNEVQIVEPIFHVDAAGDGHSEIWADQPTGGTGVSVSGTALVWMDQNRAGRVWTQIG